MSSLRGRLSFANIVSVLALFVALGGTAIAVDGPNPGQNTIGSEDIIGNEVKSDDIGNGRIFNLDIADDIIQSGKIKNGTIAESDLVSTPAPTPIPLNPSYESPEGFGPLCYRDMLGTVHLSGFVRRTAAPTGQEVGVLPEACRPDVQSAQTVTRLSNGFVGVGSSEIYVFESGSIAVDTNIPAESQLLSLGGVTFRNDLGGPGSAPATTGRIGRR